MSRKINLIVIHHSLSEGGNAALIDIAHRKRNFRCIGYHYVICNGYPDGWGGRGQWRPAWDGKIEIGRPDREVGAHTRGHNRESLGICVIGNRRFTLKQMIMLLTLCGRKMREYDLEIDRVAGHREFNTRKVCPGFDPEQFRETLRDFIIRPEVLAFYQSVYNRFGL